MLVLTPLFLAGWYAFPKRHRWVFAALGVGLALALMGSAHHFLSDVLAGAGAGALVYAGTRCALTSGELVTG
jgi:membrane-associated phospholipid phosphatase